MNWQDRISFDPAVCHGRPSIAGTRVMVSVILDSLAAGESAESLVAAYHLDPDDVRAALSYASELARDRVLGLPAGTAP